MIRHEFRKIFGVPYVWLIVVVLLLFQSFMTYADTAYLYDTVLVRENIEAEHDEAAARIVSGALQNLQEYALLQISPSSFPWQNQEKIQEMYQNLSKQVNFSETTVKGWHLLFAHLENSLPLFLAVLTVSAVAYTEEYRLSVFPIIRLYKKGRLHLAFSKIAANCLISSAVMLVFALSDFLLCGLPNGYSDLDNAVQILEPLCPYVWTIGEYLCVFLFCRLLAVVTFSAVITCLSVLFRQYVLLYLTGIGILGIQVVLVNLRFYTPDSLIQVFPLLSAASPKFLIERYHAVSFFGKAVTFLPLLWLVYGGIFAVAAIGSSVLFLRRKLFVGRLGIIRKEKLSDLAVFWQRLRHKISGEPSLSLTMAEWRKLGVVWLCLLALFGGKCFLASRAFAPDTSFTDTVYKSYMETLSGALTEEKRQWIHAERAYIDTVLAKAEDMEAQYQALALSQEEYTAYQSQYAYAASRAELFVRIEEHLLFMEQTTSEDAAPWFVYDTGWYKWFHSSFDGTEYGAILLLCLLIFPVESMGQGGGFAPILHSTQKGRSPVFWAKWRAGCLGCLLIGILWNLVDVIFLIRNFDLPCPEAPVSSLRMLSNVPLSLTIWQYSVLLTVYRLLAVCVLGILVLLITVWIVHLLASGMTVVLVTLMPYLCQQLGADIPFWLDYSSMLRGTPILTSGFMLEYSGMIGFLLILGSLAGHRHWCRNGGK